MQQCEVAQQCGHRLARLPHSERGGHGAVDSARATVGKNSETITRRHERVQVTHRHARAGDQDAAGRSCRNIAGDASLEGLVPRIDQRINRAPGRGIGVAPRPAPGTVQVRRFDTVQQGRGHRLRVAGNRERNLTRRIGLEGGERFVDLRRRLVENGIFPVCRRCCKVELSPEPVAEPFGAGAAPPRRAIPLTVVR